MISIIGFYVPAFSQSTKVSGKVVDAKTKEPLIGVNIVVKNRVVGTITDAKGAFSINLQGQPPLTLQISSLGYAQVEQEINNQNVNNLVISLEETSIMGKEIVVSASRREESIMESPVSIEKMDIVDLRSTPAANYYQGLAYLKGVDVSTSSIGFQVINARGFNSTGNVRFVQLIDGMDTQAPGLNFPISNLNGPSELDIESVEFLPGAASALYGANAFNGILLMNSKNPFQYQGLSVMGKVGVNHVNSDATSAQPLYETAIRYAKAFNNKFAFKVNFSWFQAEDWYGMDYTDQNAANQGDLSINPGYNGLHTHGDEAGINLALLRGNTDVSNGLAMALFTANPAQFGNEFSNAQNFAGAYVGNLPVIQVNRTPYEERHVVDYGAKNLKASGALHYRINDNLELLYNLNYGFGTSVYTGSNRYSLNNFNIHQHKLELKSNNFFVRAYTTQERSGDSYDAIFAALSINNDWKDNNTWFGTYAATYAGGLIQATGGNPANIGLVPANVQSQLHQAARGAADQGRLLPGTAEYDASFENWKSVAVPQGAKFNDQTNLYHAEAQYQFKEEISFLDLTAGASYRLFDLNSNGTIFADTAGNNLSIYEYGAYIQASKQLAGERLKLTGSIRYDKNENFEGQINPRLSAVYSAGANHNFRLSYQTGFRMPTSQEQHIDLFVGAYRLLGGLPQYAEAYRVTENTYLVSSINAFTNSLFAGAPNTALLMPYTQWEKLKPEQVQSYEVGYKSLINNKLFIDMAYYYSRYTNFVGAIRVRRAAAPVSSGPEGIPAALSLLSPSAETFQIYVNSDEIVTAHGAAVGINYLLGRGFELGGNYNYNALVGETREDFMSTYNTPEHKVNLMFGNRNVFGNFGFSVAWRWQDEFLWEGSFAIGKVPAYNTLDAQVNYKFDDINTMLKIGGSNLFNNYYIQNYGGPAIGGIYYVSLTFDELMR